MHALHVCVQVCVPVQVYTKSRGAHRDSALSPSTSVLREKARLAASEPQRPPVLTHVIKVTRVYCFPHGSWDPSLRLVWRERSPLCRLPGLGCFVEIRPHYAPSAGLSLWSSCLRLGLQELHTVYHCPRTRPSRGFSSPLPSA